MIAEVRVKFYNSNLGVCGNIKKDLKLSDRTYNCDKCGHSEDRDINAGKNIMNFGIRDNPAIAKVVH